MNPSDLVKGKEYEVVDPAHQDKENATYVKQTVNHYIFSNGSFEAWLCHSTVKTNVNEIPNKS